METINPIQNTGSSGERNGMLYPMMLIAAMAVIVFSVVGIATMTGVMPRALSKNEQAAPDSTAKNAPAATAPAANAPAANAPAATPAARPANARVAPSRNASAAEACSDCGVVESIRAVQTKGQGSGLGAVAGGVLGGVLGNQIGRGGGRTAMTVVGAGAGAYAGHEIEKNVNKSVSYQVRVRMNDGTYRTLHERSQPALSVGQKVRVTNNGIVAAG